MKTIDKLINDLSNPEYVRDFRPVPFWSWNDKLEPERLVKQLEWMNDCGIGGFFMHARGGLITEYLGEEWMECCDACCDKAAELGMDAYMYDENGWPSGFAGGKLLEDENNRDQWLSYEIGDFDPDSFVSYKIEKKSLVRTDKAEKGKRYLNVYRHIAVSTADILNPEVVEKFLDLTHRAYKARYGKDFAKKIKGFFTDEPQYFRWHTAYTPMIEKYFREQLKEDLLDSLGLLFAEKEGYEAFRYKYWKGMQSLMLKNFAEKIYDFCEENGVKLTGHYVEEHSLGGQMWCCGGVMPFYAYEHIPGIDWLGRGLPGERAVKQVCSVAAQTGNNRILTESFACCGWDVNPRELKKIYDYQCLGGVNVLCHHLLPVSEYGQRKRDYPQHYTPLNPWIKLHFKRFNENYTRLGALLGNSTEEVNVCLLMPISSGYIDYKREERCEEFDALERSFHNETEMLGSEHIPHHYVDETLLAQMGKAQNGKLICGECAYDYLILPSMKTMAKTTCELIEKFTASGGKLLMLGKEPTLLEGVKHKFGFKSNCTLEQIKAVQPYSIDNPELRSSMRVCEAGKFVYVINSTDKEQKFTLKTAGAKSVRILSTDTLTVTEPLPLSRSLRPLQSAILFPSSEEPVAEKEKQVIKLSGVQRMVKRTPNTFVIDSARIAREGEDFGENVPLVKTFSQLLDERYKGKLKLKYEFETDTIPADLKLVAEDMNTLKIELNGAEIQKENALEDEPHTFVYNAAKLVKKGKNEIVITLVYYQSDSVYYALFGEGVTESLRNCMVYNTALESVYLIGDFGVYPVNLRGGMTDNTAVADGFVLGAPKTEIRDFLTDGLATFAGSVTLESEIDMGDGNRLLEIGGRWQTATVEMNGKTQDLLFDTAADVSGMAHSGVNTVRVTLTTSLRNLLGPHHFAPDDEPVAIGPGEFDFAGQWQNGECALFRPTYSLVKTKF